MKTGHLLSNRPISEEWAEAAYEWVDLDAAARLLEETKSAVFSQMVGRSEEKSVARAEVAVRGSREWLDYVEKTVAARTRANKAKVRKDFINMRAWESQSKAANERAEARL